MVDKGFESSAVTINPIDHVTTIGSTESNNIVSVNKVKVLNNIGETLVKVVVGVRAPILTNSIAKGLAISSRAMWIDCYGDISGSGINLGVPTCRPVIIQTMSICDNILYELQLYLP